MLVMSYQWAPRLRVAFAIHREKVRVRPYRRLSVRSIQFLFHVSLDYACLGSYFQGRLESRPLPTHEERVSVAAEN